MPSPPCRCRATPNLRHPRFVGPTTSEARSQKSYCHPRAQRGYCAETDENGDPSPACFGPLTDETPDRAFKDSRLPITPRFKGNANARYTFDLGGGEAALSYLGDRTTDLREAQRELLGDLDAYAQADLSAGYRRDNWMIDVFLNNASDERGELTRFSQCAALVCGFQPYTVVTQPRTLTIRFTQTF